jgi:hypothetical protein
MCDLSDRRERPGGFRRLGRALPSQQRRPLERVNWLGNLARCGIQESYGIIVNYLFDPNTIEANHETFAQRRHGRAFARNGRPARRGRAVSPYRCPPD